MQTEVVMEAFHEAGLPPGVINVVTGLGEVVGTQLTQSPDIQKIAFTGSTQIGKLVAKNSLDTMKRLTLELGGRSPNIILADANLSTAIPMAINACYLNNGQACIAASRLIVPEDRRQSPAARAVWGPNIAEAVPESGDRLVATVRDTTRDGLRI
jgi:aldehyde dehydrogenase (NAD+)